MENKPLFCVAGRMYCGSQLRSSYTRAQLVAGGRSDIPRSRYVFSSLHLFRRSFFPRFGNGCHNVSLGDMCFLRTILIVLVCGVACISG